MAHLVVGDKSCGYNLVIKTMRKSDTFHEIVNERAALATELDIKLDVLAIINKNYKLLDDGPNEILLAYLPKWRSSFAQEAKLGKLLDAFDECGLKDISNTVRKAEFFVKATEERQQSGQKVVNILGPSSSSQLVTFQDDLVPNQINELENTEMMDEDGKKSRFLSLFSKTGNITTHQWACRTFTSAKNSTVLLKRRCEGDPKLGKGRYALPGTENGYALILNMISYPTHAKHPYRDGAQYDSLRLTQLFTQLGYKVMKFDDSSLLYTKSDVEAIVQQFRDLIRKDKPKSLVVFVGGHGAYGKIETSDGKLVDLFTSIIYQFDSNVCPELKQVPKIFIVNSCRDPIQIDSRTFNMQDAVVCYSALPANVSYRNPEFGSLYIKSFVRIMAKHACDTDFISMIRMISKDVRRNSKPKDDHAAQELQHPMYEEYGDFGQLYFNVFEDRCLDNDSAEDSN